MFMCRRSKSKFCNKPLTVGDLNFDSELEQRVYSQLLIMPSIKSVELHKRFDLVVNGQKICAVEPDFTVHLKLGSVLYADAKSNPTETDVSRIKFKLFHALFGQKVWILPREMGSFIDLCQRNINHEMFEEVDSDNTNP